MVPAILVVGSSGAAASGASKAVGACPLGFLKVLGALVEVSPLPTRFTDIDQVMLLSLVLLLLRSLKEKFMNRCYRTTLFVLYRELLQRNLLR